MRYRVFLAVGLLLLLAASPATAKPLDTGHYAYSNPPVPGECGDGSPGSGYVTVSSGHGTYMIKDATPATGGQFFYFQTKYWWQDVFTNPDTGQWAVARGNGIYKESRAVAVGDGVFTNHDIEAGQPFVIEDMFGRVVSREPRARRHLVHIRHAE